MLINLTKRIEHLHLNFFKNIKGCSIVIAILVKPTTQSELIELVLPQAAQLGLISQLTIRDATP